MYALPLRSVVFAIVPHCGGTHAREPSEDQDTGTMVPGTGRIVPIPSNAQLLATTIPRGASRFSLGVGQEIASGAKGISSSNVPRQRQRAGDRLSQLDDTADE
jgi:hypothetical protein